MIRGLEQVFNLKRRLCNLIAAFNCLTGSAKGNGAKLVCGGWYSTGQWQQVADWDFQNGHLGKKLFTNKVVWYHNKIS